MEETLMQNPYYAKAIEFIANIDLNTLENGKHFIDGDNLFVNIVDSNMKTPEQARLEVHDKYIDIQIPLSKAETFGVKPRSECTSPVGEMDEVKDILFYSDPVEKTITAGIGEVVTFAPETAHAPLIGEGTIDSYLYKLIMKKGSIASKVTGEQDSAIKDAAYFDELADLVLQNSLKKK